MKTKRDRRQYNFLKFAPRFHQELADNAISSSTLSRLFAVQVKFGSHNRGVVVCLHKGEFYVVCNVPSIINDNQIFTTEIVYKDWDAMRTADKCKPLTGQGNWFQTVKGRIDNIKNDHGLNNYFKFVRHVRSPELTSILRTFATYHWTSVELMSNTLNGSNMWLAEKYPTCPILDWAYKPAIWHGFIADNAAKKLGTMADVWELGPEGFYEWLMEEFTASPHDHEKMARKVIHDFRKWFNYHIGMHNVATNELIEQIPFRNKMELRPWEARLPIRWNDIYGDTAKKVGDTLNKVNDLELDYTL